ncbi:aminotransferase class I/II-fold pyridoxal phosphate-dependent enzyme [Caldimonas tepidiphila]|uniref:aminotransferase class I/II-fold pyridoxal phosphate-dependent enzyme n=1 Tax=Caldimonas tepidiphila TaxID=2315841 RepID=UPI000E5A9C72|nr:8-amino-7-oxononanoate synthase [Caldimonas tepidiphila]
MSQEVTSPAPSARAPDDCYAAHSLSLEAAHLRRRLRPSRPRGLVADFSHNDYLGLARSPALVEAAARAAAEHGVGATGSRLLSGNLEIHEALERSIAQAKGTEAALVFATGYQANAAVLAALLDAKVLGGEPRVYTDRLIHASLHHGLQLAGVRQQRFRHNDLAHLAELLERDAALPGARFIVSETVFGMDGDLLDIDALVALADRHRAFLYLDEAHATGVLGPRGHGLAAGRMRAADGRSRGVAMGTFSKGIGAAGAYVACSLAVRDYLLSRCGGFVYSTAPSPAVVGAVQAAWELLPGLDAERAALQAAAADLRERVRALGYDTGTSQTHIVPLVVGDEARALALQAFLQQRGLLASAVRPPTVPPGTARVRIALAASHTAAQVDALVAALAEWARA